MFYKYQLCFSKTFSEHIINCENLSHFRTESSIKMEKGIKKEKHISEIRDKKGNLISKQTVTTEEAVKVPKQDEHKHSRPAIKNSDSKERHAKDMGVRHSLLS